MLKSVESLEARRLLSASVEASNPIITVVGTEISFNRAGEYSFEAVPSKSPKIKVKLDGGHATMLPKSQFDSIDSYKLAPGAVVSVDYGDLSGLTVTGQGVMNVTGVSFTEANVATGGYKFEPNQDLDGLLQSGFLLGPATSVGWENNIEQTMSRLQVNGSTTDAFKVVWDYLDDNYSYYNTPVNEGFVRLGVEYAEYLDNGGEALTSVVAKYAPDSTALTDPDTLPERSQSMHDNLLGNFHASSMEDRFGTGSLLAEMKTLIPDDLEGRGVYSGSDSDYGSDNHKAVIQFDLNQGWVRPDADLLLA